MTRDSLDANEPIKPEDDARLAPLEAEIEREWSQHRRSYYRLLKAEGKLTETVHDTALWCIKIMHQFEEKGLHPDQAREAIREIIFPDTGS